MKLFGREPAVIITLVGAFLTFLVSVNLSFLNAGQAAAILALASAVVAAVYTRPFTPALVTGVIVAGAALFYEYGLHLTDAQVGGFTGLALAVAGLFTVRPQVSPTSGS